VLAVITLSRKDARKNAKQNAKRQPQDGGSRSVTPWTRSTWGMAGGRLDVESRRKETICTLGFINQPGIVDGTGKSTSQRKIPSETVFAVLPANRLIIEQLNYTMIGNPVLGENANTERYQEKRSTENKKQGPARAVTLKSPKSASRSV